MNNMNIILLEQYDHGQHLVSNSDPSGDHNHDQHLALDSDPSGGHNQHPDGLPTTIFSTVRRS